MPHPNTEETTHITARREKLEALKNSGVALYPNTFKPKNSFQEILERFQEIQDKATLAGEEIRTAGRVMLLRCFGKLTFARLQDESNAIQIAVQRDEIGADLYREVFRKVETGDILGVEGHLFRTKTGELTIRVQKFQILAKALRPLPEKWHGLEDVETRYRQRYLDLIVHPEVRNRFRMRSHIVRLVRNFMEDRRFLEVETPMMQPIPGGATARPFVTYHNALNRDLYLRVAPELYLKRLIVGGFEKVFEINRNFRNEGLSVRHNPEFTMIEFYQAYADYQEMMTLTEALFLHLSTTIHGGPKFTYQGKEIDMTPTWPRLTLAEAVIRYAGASEKDLSDSKSLMAFARTHNITLNPNWDYGKQLLEVFEELVEDRLIQPTFITGYPTSVSPLSRPSDRNPEIVDRFELFIGGWEIANAFSELNDPLDQARRFQQQAEEHSAGDPEAMHFDADYIHALEHGMPPTAGEGIGIDRLVMLLTDVASIREVLLFPQLRPKA